MCEKGVGEGGRRGVWEKGGSVGEGGGCGRRGWVRECGRRVWVWEKGVGVGEGGG